MMKSIPLNEATTEELREFGQQVLGMSIHPSTKPENARERVRQAWDKENIFLSVPDQSAPAAQTQQGTPPSPVTADQQMPKPGYVRIKIPQSEAPGGRDAVQVSVNGRAMLIPRDKECDIRYRYLEVLKNAVAAIYDPLPDGGISATPRMVPVHNFQIIAMGERIPETEDQQQAA